MPLGTFLAVGKAFEIFSDAKR